MHNEIQDAQFTDVKNQAPVINAAEHTEMIAADEDVWIWIKEIAEKSKYRDPKTIKNWAEQDGRPTYRANTAWNTGQVRVESKSWILKKLKEKGKSTEWIEVGDFNPVTALNNEIEVTGSKQKNLTAYNLNNTQIDAMIKNASKEVIDKIFNDIGIVQHKQKKNPMLWLVVAIILIVASSASAVIYLIHSQLNDNKSYRELVTKRYEQDIERYKQTKDQTNVQHNQTLKRMQEHHKQQMMLQDEKMEIILEETKKIEASINEFLPVFEEDCK